MVAAASERRRTPALALPLFVVVAVYGLSHVGISTVTPASPSLTLPKAPLESIANPAPLEQQSLHRSDAAADAPPLATLLSRSTPLWERLLSEGLYHPSSGYPKLQPQQDSDAREQRFWEDRVLTEFRDGCRVANGTKQCLPRLIIAGQFKAGTTALFDMLAQHPDVLLPRKTREHKWHEMCPLERPECVIKEVNGFTRLGERQRWNERALFTRYNILPTQALNDTRPVLEASPYYLAGMPDSYEDLTRFVRFIPGVKMIALVRNPVDRAFSEYLMFSEPPFKPNSTGCGRGPSRARFEALAAEELAVASPALLEESGMAHRCLVESSKWQTVPKVQGKTGFKGRLLRWGEYHHYLSTWMRVLGPDQLVVVRNEDMDAQPERVLAELQAWAGLRSAVLAPLHTNLAACRGSIARGAWDAKKKAQADSGQCAGAGPWAAQKRVDPGAVAALQAHFAPHNAALHALTGQDFSDWDRDVNPLYLGRKSSSDGVDWGAALVAAAARGGRSSGAVPAQTQRQPAA